MKGNFFLCLLERIFNQMKKPCSAFLLFISIALSSCLASHRGGQTRWKNSREEIILYGSTCFFGIDKKKVKGHKKQKHEIGIPYNDDYYKTHYEYAKRGQ